jgi:hypothetical protein
VHPHRHFNLRRGAAAALVAAGSLLLATAPAHATPPTTTVEQRHVVLPLASCGSFTLILESDVTREVTTFYDRDGLKVRDVLTRRQEGTFSNSVTGKSAALSGIWRVTRYYTDGQLNGTVTQTGRTYTVTVPGRGVIFHQSGRGIQENGETVFQAGPHDFDEANFAELCNYLAS